MECDITLMTCYMSLCNILSSLSTSGPHTSRSCLCPEQLTPGVCLLKVCFFILWEQTWHLVHTLLYRLVTRPIGLSTEHLDLLLMALSFLLKLSPQKVDSGPTDRQFRQVNGGELAQPVKRHDTGPQICEYWFFTIRVRGLLILTTICAVLGSRALLLKGAEKRIKLHFAYHCHLMSYEMVALQLILIIHKKFQDWCIMAGLSVWYILPGTCIYFTCICSC